MKSDESCSVSGGVKRGMGRTPQRHRLWRYRGGQGEQQRNEENLLLEQHLQKESCVGYQVQKELVSVIKTRRSLCQLSRPEGACVGCQDQKEGCVGY